MPQNIVVLKFGGSSVATYDNWQKIKSAVHDRLNEGLKPIVVCSAVKGITNLLEKLTTEFDQRDKLCEEIKDTHIKLAKELGVSAPEALLMEEFSILAKLSLGVSLLGYCHPKVKANLLALGELMSTKLGAKFLNSSKVATEWVDARVVLHSSKDSYRVDSDKYLNVVCDDLTPRTNLFKGSDCVITQGFIASNDQGETVLLGRGGSDTAAAYFASLSEACRLEIWTDVPGMFTTNPQANPSALLLKELDYEEAKELASAGAKVLHPRCIEPVAQKNIPLYICWTEHPDSKGTVVSSSTSDSSPHFKAVVAKKNIHLITVETIEMWQEVGFLAQVFGCFRKQGVSVDLVATSQNTITVSLDPLNNELLDSRIPLLLEDLNQFSRAKQIGPCASVSLVGKEIGAVFQQLSPTLEILTDHKIYIVSQSESNLNFTFIIDETHVDRVVSKIHSSFFSSENYPAIFGPSWNQLYTASAAPVLHHTSAPWWQNKQEELLSLMGDKDHCYVYDLNTIKDAIHQLKGIQGLDRLCYAMKANFHPEILQFAFDQGVHFDCVSLAEIEHLFSHINGMSVDRIVFTPNFAPIDEYKAALDRGIMVTLDCLHPIQAHPDLFANKSIMIRVDPGIAKGHHKHVQTAGHKSKFGMGMSELTELKKIAAKHHISVVGLHVHVGSGIRNAETWGENALFLAEVAKDFKEVKILDLGGGFGIVEKPEDKAIDWAKLSTLLLDFKKAHPQFELWAEPGRFLTSHAGVLLAKVTQVKQKMGRRFVGVSTGMNSLIRYPLYGSYHPISNLTRLNQPLSQKVDVVGPICETGDVFAHDRDLPDCFEGDVLAVGNAGAYGRVMASNYNLREPAQEVVLK